MLSSSYMIVYIDIKNEIPTIIYINTTISCNIQKQSIIINNGLRFQG